MRPLLLSLVCLARLALATSPDCPTPRVFLPSPHDNTKACEVGRNPDCNLTPTDRAILGKASASCVENKLGDCADTIIRFPNGKIYINCVPKLPRI